MKEIAFTVNPDSELYANHFIQKAEKKRFAELASAFLNAHFPGEGNNSIMLGKRLEVELSPETEEKFRSQLLKTRTAVAFPCSKQNPPKISAGTRRLFPKLTSKNTKPLVFGGWIFRALGICAQVSGMMETAMSMVTIVPNSTLTRARFLTTPQKSS